MKFYFLSYTKLLALKFNNYVLSKLFNFSIKFDKSIYSLRKDFTPKDSSEKNRVGLYFDDKKISVIIKKHKFKKVDIDFLYLINEASVLSLVNAFNISNKKKVKIPSLIEFGLYKNELFVVTEFVSGKTVENLNNQKLLNIIERSLMYLTEISQEFKEKDFGVLKKSGFYFLCVFPYFLIKSYFSTKRDLTLFVKLGLLFYWNYLLGKPLNKPLFLTHCELFQDSILFDQKNNQITLIDWEAAILSDQCYELALISRYYFEKFNKIQLNSLIRTRVNNINDFRRFKALAIFAGLEFLINRPKNKRSIDSGIKYFKSIILLKYSI